MGGGGAGSGRSLEWAFGLLAGPQRSLQMMQRKVESPWPAIFIHMVRPAWDDGDA